MKKIMAFIFACIISLFSISNVKAEDYVAKIGETNYATLEEAIKAADDSSIINLLGEGTLSFNPNKSLTFVGNGKISVKGSEPWDSYRGVLTLKGSGVTFEWEDDTNSWLMMALSGTINIEDGATMRFKFNSNSTATRNAIYMNAGSVINVKNGSHLEIIAETTTNAIGQGIQLNNANKSFINVTGGSTFLIDGTNRGYVNSPNIYVEDSTFTVQNCTSNGSNGGKFTAINSDITFYNNGALGLSATSVNSTNSIFNLNNNKMAGLVISSIDTYSKFDKDSKVYINNNGANIYGAFAVASNVTFESGSTLKVNNNNTVGIRVLQGILSWIGQDNDNGKTIGVLTIEDGVTFEVTNNINNKEITTSRIPTNYSGSTYGGGVWTNSTVILPNNAVIYNNHALSAGDDIYVEESGIITLGNVGTDWYLDGEPDCEDLINGWYDDSEITENQDSAIIGGRWNAHGENLHIEVVNADKYEGALAIKAAHNLEGKVITHYVDEEGNTLLEDKTITGYVNDEYQTTSEEIDGYTLIEVKGEEKGKITEEDTEVTYVYQFTKGQGSVEEPVINPPVEEPPHTSVNTSIYALVLLVNVLGISVLLKKREN